MSLRRRHLILAAGAAALGLGPGARAAKLAQGAAMPGFDGAVTWLNGPPRTPQQLRGKVVLVDFWTYSCINCIRTLPYVRAWAQKYAAQGLTVIGVHTPEFKFERDLANVNAAIGRFGIDFPVAVDSDHRIWQAWGNRAWPAYYLVDANGTIRHQQLGEGGYDTMERAIQALLAEARGGAVDTGLVAPRALAEQAAPDESRLASGETYVGYGRADNFGSRERVKADAPARYSLGPLGLNEWGLSGLWTVREESAVAGLADSGVAFQFSARDLHLVMGAGGPGRTVRIKVTLDGRAPGMDHGADIDADGNGVVTGTRLYQLIRQAGKGSASRAGMRFEVRFLDAGAEVYAFTFG
jgi:thiol-disulfide isomerase/thioredoxin